MKFIFISILKDDNGVHYCENSDAIKGIDYSKLLELEEDVSPKAYIEMEDDKIMYHLMPEEAETPSNWKEVDFLGANGGKKYNEAEGKYEIDTDLEHTDENPLLLVATDNVEFFQSTKNHIKYFVFDDVILVALLKGSMRFEEDDNFIIDRNFTRQSIRGRAIPAGVMGVKDFFDMQNLVDDKVGYNLHLNRINDAIISYNKDCRSLKFNREEDSKPIHNDVFSQKLIDIIEKKNKELEEKKRLKESKALVRKRKNEVTSYFNKDSKSNSSFISYYNENKETFTKDDFDEYLEDKFTVVFSKGLNVDEMLELTKHFESEKAGFFKAVEEKEKKPRTRKKKEKEEVVEVKPTSSEDAASLFRNWASNIARD